MSDLKVNLFTRRMLNASAVCMSEVEHSKDRIAMENIIFIGCIGDNDWSDGCGADVMW